MTAVLLHLSDIHIKTAKDPVLRRGADIAACLYSVLPEASHIFLVISGDVAFSGEKEQYELAANFLHQIESTLRIETSVPITFIVAPGNHDCDFSLDSGARKLLVKAMEESNPISVDESIIDTCTSIQKPFFEFRTALENNPAAKDDKLWRTSLHEVGDQTIAFECLNVSWVSKINEDPGRLYFPITRYTGNAPENADVRLVVLHHPLNWFNQSIYRPFRVHVRQLADILISGHEHQGNVGFIIDAETEKSAFVEGCVLQGNKDLSDSSFNVIQLDLAEKRFSSTRFLWSGNGYIATEVGSWSNYHSLPMKQSNPFSISEVFKGLLEDPGAYFKHPGSINITLSDIYIFPDLHKVVGSEEHRRNYVNSKILLTPEVTANGILVEAEEKAGSTSLLYQLFTQYHARGFIPVYIKGKELKKASEGEIDAVVRHSVQAQYGVDAPPRFEQQPASKKILFVDDFDGGPVKSASARAELLCALKRRFAHLVVTVSELFEMREMLDGDESKQLLSLEHYQLLPFSYTLRSKLIERWYSLSTDGTIDEGTLLARCDQAERVIDTVMAKTFIPRLPLYLLTLIQSMESGRSGDFRGSSLGYYYQYLLTEAFQDSGVKPEKLTEHYKYSACLAWEFHAKEKHELSELELREFNSRFSSKWHTVDFSSRMDVLLKARVLCRSGDDYTFRYPYIYYYLKGQYLSENLDDLAIRAYVGHCCHHLYVRENANTVLFLAHHSTEEFILRAISEALNGLFRKRAPLRFDGDTAAICSVIEEAPKLIYDGHSPKEHRDERNKIQDELDEGHDGLADAEEESEELSLIAQMTMLFKTTEILGQVLKNQYSKIARTRKEELLDDLFKGPLRAINDFYSFFEKNPDALAAEIEAALQRKGAIQDDEERKQFARMVAASLVHVVTFSFVMRASEAARADDLLEDVNNVVKQNGSLAYKLIELGIVLDSPKQLPKALLKQLNKEVEKYPMAARVMQFMVLNRLYMFKTTERDMQWLASELDFDISRQHAITYATKQTKRLS